MSIVIGLIATIVTVLCWGSYLVPMKRIKEYNPFYFQLLMCTAILISSLIISLIYNSFVFSYLGILSGILWSVGNLLSVLAVKYSGLSKAASLWVGILIFTSFLWGVLFFKEKLVIALGAVGILILVVGIILISSITQNKKSSNNKGLIFAVFAGLIFGSYIVPFKLSGLQPIPFLFPMSIGILIGSLLIFSAKRPKIDKSIILPGTFSGLLWNIANFASFFVVLNLGMAVGFPLTQVSLFVAILWGVLYFREITEKNKIIRLVIGAIILFAGVILLTLST